MRVDDSMRERGLWTVGRLLRLRRVAVALLIGALAWLPTIAAVALEISRSPLVARPPQHLVEACAIVTVLVHTASLAFGAIGGTYASSRQSYHARLWLTVSMSAVLVVAGCCLSTAIAGVRPLQRAFEDWGFAASGAARTAGVTITLFWLATGLRTTSLVGTIRRRVVSAFVVAYPIAWTIVLAAVTVGPSKRWFASGAGKWALASIVALDGIALVVVAATAVSCVSSAAYTAEIAAARRRAPSIEPESTDD